MKRTTQQEKKLLESRKALNFYLANLFQDTEVEDTEEVNETTEFEEEFDVLGITLGEHQLALTVNDLNGVIDVEPSEVVRLPEQEPYCYGLISFHGKQLPLYDLYWVFNSTGKLSPPAESGDLKAVHHAVVVEGNQFAIACDQVSQITRVQSDQVSWVKSRANRPWLLGVIKQEMHTLLSVKEVKQLFLKGFTAPQNP